MFLSVAQAFDQLLDSPESSHRTAILISIRDFSTENLFPRASLKRPAPDSNLSVNQGRNQRQGPASGSGPQASQDRDARRPVSQSNSGQGMDGNRRLGASPALSRGREPGGTRRAARAPPSRSPTPSQRSQSRQGTSPAASPGHDRLSRNGSGRTYSTSSGQGQSTGSNQEKTSSAHSRGSRASESQLSGSATGSIKTLSEDELSSVPSSPQRTYPVSVSTLTKGPATVTTWTGRSRGGGTSASHVSEGQWRMTDGSNPRTVLTAITHHSHAAETYAFGTGQRAGIRTVVRGLNNDATRITIPRADGEHETHKGGSISHKAANQDIVSGAQIMGSFKGQGRFAIEAKNPDTDSNSELDI